MKAAGMGWAWVQYSSIPGAVLYFRSRLKIHLSNLAHTVKQQCIMT